MKSTKNEKNTKVQKISKTFGILFSVIYCAQK
jgi:hypothetical protein